MSTNAEKERVAKRRRDKVQLSCNLCRKRKQVLRCNRVQPCWNCSSRGLASSCVFPDNSKVPPAPATAATTTAAGSFQDRINHLEGLVVQLLQQDQRPDKPTAAAPQLCARCAEPLGGEPRASPTTATTTPPSTTSPPPPAPSSSSSHAHIDVGKLQIDSAKSAYVSSPHWSAVLSGLSELKSFWPAAATTGEHYDDDDDGDDNDDFFPGDQSDNQYYEAETDATSPHQSPLQQMPTPTLATHGKRRFQLLFGGNRKQSLDKILRAMPPRDDVDRLVLLYFNNSMLPLAVIHSGSFLSQYEKFWKSPHDTPILWIALLFGIISIASQTEAAWSLYGSFPPPPHPSSSRSPPPAPSQPPGPLSSPFPLQTPPYVDQVVACLLLGEYTKGGTHALEALLHYQFIEVASAADGHADAWLLSGVVTRLAYRMGYHRDPSHFPSLGAFEGETRRRLWITIHGMDIMVSAQMGLPRLIKAGSADVQLPRNLHDADLVPGCAELPPERPWSDRTPTLHLISKHRMFVVIGTITDVNMSVGPECPPLTVARERELTALIQDTYDGLPEQCKFTGMLGCVADRAADVIHRIGAGALLQKGLIAIHWRRMMARDARDEAEHLRVADVDAADGAYARRSYVVCIRAALRVLGYQAIMEGESRPGGALFPQRIQASSVLKHEFLTSTVLLCRHMYRVVAGPFGSPLLEAVMESTSSGSYGARGDDFDGADDDDDETLLPEPQVIEAALRRSHGIWQRGSAVSAEARRISSILDALFKKLGTTMSPRASELVLTSTSPFDGIDPGLALLDEFGLLQHLQGMNGCFDV
ncbi:fungal specific transcription factor [Cordyceps fumosorosea ARSEF 2679]|uniref:Fungal specific transcription factor n=1 Tax=Cordyceps fumosorosea (strain ARSEF 2679) TaxID=1081104 RepID=A0A167V0A7_CORFA|nr:fungal specific transcription factor [Cordyceps fumosorosea ARSEF 2679]OAA62086.1 fungal specific transcription factor [Cordyceps fumosorosea ARSEF 2679]